MSSALWYVILVMPFNQKYGRGIPEMNKRNIVIGILIIALSSLNFVFKPYLRRRDALRIVETVLTYWKNGDLTLAMPYWEKEINSPPVYGLITYEITGGKISKKDGIHSAEVTANLEFPLDNPSHSGKKWIFELNKTRYGWKITGYQHIEN